MLEYLPMGIIDILPEAFEDEVFAHQILQAALDQHKDEIFVSFADDYLEVESLRQFLSVSPLGALERKEVLQQIFNRLDSPIPAFILKVMPEVRFLLKDLNINKVAIKRAVESYQGKSKVSYGENLSLMVSASNYQLFLDELANDSALCQITELELVGLLRELTQRNEFKMMEEFFKRYDSVGGDRNKIMNALMESVHLVRSKKICKLIDNYYKLFSVVFEDKEGNNIYHKIIKNKDPRNDNLGSSLTFLLKDKKDISYLFYKENHQKKTPLELMAENSQEKFIHGFFSLLENQFKISSFLWEKIESSPKVSANVKGILERKKIIIPDIELALKVLASEETLLEIIKKDPNSLLQKNENGIYPLTTVILNYTGTMMLELSENHVSILKKAINIPAFVESIISYDKCDILDLMFELAEMTSGDLDTSIKEIPELIVRYNSIACLRVFNKYFHVFPAWKRTILTSSNTEMMREAIKK